jgi:hypothetical protein
MAQVYGAGGKTLPKKGRLGTGSYYPTLGTPLFQHSGNAFAGINVERPEFIQLTFGNPSRAGVATVVGQDRSQTEPIHPNKAHYNINTQPHAPAMVVGSSNDRSNFQPVSPKMVTLSMPHERNTNSASGTKKKPNPYRTAFGASATMASDTAFHHDRNANYKHTVRKPPKSAVEGVKQRVDPSQRTFGVDNVDHSPGSASPPTKQRRTPPPSFRSRGNQWYDANNSFIAGQDGGVGRWTMVKRGVV